MVGARVRLGTGGEGLSLSGCNGWLRYRGQRKIQMRTVWESISSIRNAERE